VKIFFLKKGEKKFVKKIKIKNLKKNWKIEKFDKKSFF